MEENKENRGSLTFFTTYRPNVKTDIYSCPISPACPFSPTSCPISNNKPNSQEHEQEQEICMTDHKSYNYTGQSIPPQALKLILQKLQSKAKEKNKSLPWEFSESDINESRFSGLLFVSERKGGLETLHFSISHNSGRSEVFQFFDVYDTVYSGVRMEDSGCFAGDYLIYVSTMDPICENYPTKRVRRQPWTAVYRTNLGSGETTRLTPQGKADLSPAVSPCGKKIAVASFQGKDKGWDGEIEYLETNIYVFNIDNPEERALVVKGGGWPTWGSENVLYFHTFDKGQWGVFRLDVTRIIDNPNKPTRVTPEDIDAFTPLALSETKVAVVTIRQKTEFDEPKNKAEQYRHIEIFECGQKDSTRITQKIKPLADHYNPFLIPASGCYDGVDSGRFGYHRSNLEYHCSDLSSCPMDGGNHEDKQEDLEKIESPEPNVELYRVSGAFPSYSPDNRKLAFVDNEFKTLYVIYYVGDDKPETEILLQEKSSNRVFAPVWNKNPEKDTLYVCKGPAFNPNGIVEIHAILNVCCKKSRQTVKLVCDLFNNAFPSTNPEGTRLVFRSTRDGGDKKYKNLYIIENLEELEEARKVPMDANSEAMENNAEKKTVDAKITRLTSGNWVDTHCEWSPMTPNRKANWIAFASNRDRKSDDPDHNLDTGRFAVYLVDPDSMEKNVVRVIYSRSDDYAGHVNHPVFSPDGKSLSVVADLAAVSCDPISLPHFIHSVRPYGDLFVVDFKNNEDIKGNEDIMDFRRVTHSRYENSTAVWTQFSCSKCPLWKTFCLYKNKLITYQAQRDSPNANGGESRCVSGHICIAQRSC